MDAQSLVELGSALAAGALFVAWRRATKATHRPTFLICGGSGVGKSTLVNVLGGRPLAAVGTGPPLTRQTERFDFPGTAVTIYDSKGLEVQEASQIYLLLLTDILRLRYAARPTDHLDLVVICIQESQNRIDDAHREIATLCEDLNVPFGIAITKTIGRSELETKVRAAFPQAKFVQRVRAIEFRPFGCETTIPPEGVESLFDKMRTFGLWHEFAARDRARIAPSAEKLALLARSLAATDSPSDKMWVEFATAASGLISMTSKAFLELLGTMRGQQKKELVPNLLARFVFNRFDNERIDGAHARRLVPLLLRRFSKKTGTLLPGDITQALREATIAFEEDRPYRARF